MNAPFVVAQATPVAAPANSPQRVIKIAKPDGAQAVKLQLDNSTRLDLSDIGNEKVTFVRVGDQLVILFDNQATVSVDSFFDNNGQPVQNLSIQLSDDRVVGGAEFATLFPVTTDQSILPAAGTPGAPNSGANFQDVTVEGFGARNALGLLSGEDGAGAGNGGVEALNNTVPRIGQIALGNADDEGLSEGNLGGPGDEPGEATKITISLNVDFGQDLTGRALSFAATQPGLAGLFSGGQAVTLALTVIGGLPALVGYTGLDPADPASHVFTITLDTTPLNGEYTFTLLKPLDHPIAGTEDTLTLSIDFIATDGNGDTANGTFQVAVNDDSPTADTVVVGAITEDAGGPNTITNASLEISWGADRSNTGPGLPGDRSVGFTQTDPALAGNNVTATGTSGFAGPLTSNGELVRYTFIGDVLVGYVGLSVPALIGDASIVFTVSLSDVGPTGKGSYTFELRQPLDHPAPDVAEHYIELTIDFTAVDSDGDPIDGSFTVNIDANGVISVDGKTIDYSTLTEGVFINLADTAQIGPGVFPGIQTVDGNTATDHDGAIVKVVGIDRLGTLIVNATGGSGDDVIIGGNEANILLGQDGDDTMRGMGGDDTLEGGKGDDFLRGDGGNDTLRGGDDNDQLVGNRGDDKLYGDAGHDLLDGGRGDDEMHGGLGNDDLYGGRGADTMYGDEGQDLMYGGRGDDIMFGGKGADVLDGGRGDDILYGDEGSDRLFGGRGNDHLFGGTGADLLDGGRGDDTLDGGRGDDLLLGGRGNDTLHGRQGSDVLAGEEGDDNLFGGAGRDWLAYVSGWGQDLFVGGEAGNDYDTAVFVKLAQDGDLTIDMTGFEAFTADFVGTAGVEVMASEIERIWAADLSGEIGDRLLIEGTGGSDHFILTSNPFQEGLLGETVIASFGYDTVRIAGGNGADIIDASDYLFGGVVLRGGGGDDEIVGSDQADDIRGGKGNDDLRGGGGDDVFGYDVGDGQDTVRGGAGNDLQNIYGSATSETFNVNAITLGGQQFVGINILNGIAPAQDVDATGSNYEVATRNVEDIYIETGVGADNVIISGSLGGTGLAQSTIHIEDGAGNSGDTVDARGLTSQHGIEFIGHGGDDTFYVSGAGGNDTFIGGNGTDTIDYSDVGNAVTVDLGNSQAQDTGDGRDTIRGVENAVGTNFDDTLTGNDDANVLTGNGGHDTIKGGLGSDTIIAGADIDTAVYDEASTAASFAFDGTHWTVTIGGDTDTLIGVEKVTFGDGKTFLMVDHAGADVGGYQTIQAAVNAADPADTVLVGGGTYNESVTVSEGITIQGIGAVTVNGGNVNANPAFKILGGGAGQNLVIDNIDVTGNADAVIQVEKTAVYNEIAFKNGNVTGGDSFGFFLNNATGVSGVVIENAVFAGNCTVNDSDPGEGPITIFKYNGDVTLTNVTVQNPGIGAENGIQIRGIDAVAPMGDVTFDNVNVTGTYLKTGVFLYGYSNVDGLEFTGTGLNVNVNAAWFGLNIENVGGTVDLFGLPLAVVNTHSSTSSDDIALQGLVSGGDEFFSSVDFFSDDVLIGGEGSDFLNGRRGNDLFIYTPGNDDGSITGDGSDFMIGGDGIDTLKIERLENGQNNYTFTGDPLGFFALIDHIGPVTANDLLTGMEIEKIDLGLKAGEVAEFEGNMFLVTNATVTGDDGNQFVVTTGLTSGTKINADLRGGNDSLHVGNHLTGVSVDGGTSAGDRDYLSYDGIASAVIIDLAGGFAVRGGVIDLVTNFEDARGGSSNDTIYGTSGANYIWGGAGNDTIDGRGGDDVLDGGAGDDTFTHRLGDGQDQIVGGETAESIGDTLMVEGDGTAQSFTLTATGTGTSFEIDTGAAAGAEITATDIENATLDLAGGTDALTVNGLDTVADEIITLSGNASSFTVNGTYLPKATVTSGENLTVNGNGGNDIIDASGLIVTAPSQAGTGSGPQVNSIGFLGDNAGGLIPAVTPVSYVAQSFVAKSGPLNELSFTLQQSTGPDAVDFRVLLVAWDAGLNRPVPGAPLYESATLTKAADAASQTFTVAPNLALVAGQTYAFIVDAFVGRDDTPGVVRVAATTSSVEQGSVFSNFAVGGDTRDIHFASTWTGADGWDLAYQMSYGPSMAVTLNGGDGDDTITGSTGNDAIFGGADNDTINYAVGSGSDVVDGGTGADKLNVTGTNGVETYNINAITLNGEAHLGINIESGANNNVLATSTNYEVATKAVEDIFIVTNGGGDTVNVTGSLGGTGLAQSTIHIDTGAGDDTVNLSLRTSAHRVVYDGGADIDSVKYAFNYADAAYQLVWNDAGDVGVKITHVVDGESVSDEFFNVENFLFADGPRNLDQLFNQVPETENTTASGNEDTLITVVLRGDDTDGNLAGFRVTTASANGQLYADAAGTQLIAMGHTLASTGPLTVYFKPNSDWNGSTTFEYAAVDSFNLVDQTPATATVTVTAVNDAPVLSVPQSLTVAEDTEIVFSAANGNQLRVTDVDLGAGSVDFRLEWTSGSIYIPLTHTWYSSAQQPVGISGPVDGLNQILEGVKFRPDANFVGDVEIRVLVDDNGLAGSGGVLSDAETVTIHVTPLPDAPVAVDDNIGATEDTLLTIDAANGVLKNDYDPDAGDVIAVVAETVTTAQGGTITFAADGSYTYTAAADFNGVDSVSYTVRDQSGATDTGTLNITVGAVNDAPVLTVPQSVTVAEDTEFVFSAANGSSLRAADVDLGNGVVDFKLEWTNGSIYLPLTHTWYSSAQQPVSISGPIDGLNQILEGVKFRPDADFVGDAVINVSVDDNGLAGSGGVKSDSETITIHVTAQNDAPDAVNDILNLAIGPQANPPTLSGGDAPNDRDDYNFTYYDANGNYGWEYFDSNGHWYKVVDDTGTRVTFAQAMAAADAAGGYLATITSQAESNFIRDLKTANLALYIGATDSEIEGTWKWVTGPEAGTIFWANGSAVNGAYAPWAAGEPNNAGNIEDAATFPLTAGWNDVPLTTLTGYVIEWSPPTAEQSGVLENQSKSFSKSLLLANDTDPDGDTLDILSVQGTSTKGATISYDANTGQITYNAATGAFAYLAFGQTTTDTFTYTITDGHGGTDTATATITVVGKNDAVVIGAPGAGEVVEDFYLTAPQTERVTNGTFPNTTSGWTIANANSVYGGLVTAGGSTAYSIYTYGTTTPTTMTQTLTTKVGVTYDVQFYMSNANSSDNSLKVTWGGVTYIALEDISPTGSYDDMRLYSFKALATSASTVFQISAVSPSASLIFDNISVKPSSSETTTGVLNFTDAELADTHTVTASAKGTGYLGTFEAQITNAATGDGAGQVTWKFNVDDSLIQNLNAGESIQQVYTVAVKDSSGNVTNQDVTVTIKGANDAPTLGADTVLIGGFTNDAPGTAAATPSIQETSGNNTNYNSSGTQTIARSEFKIAPNGDLDVQSAPSVIIKGAIAAGFNPVDKDVYKLDLKVGEKLIFDIDRTTNNLDTFINLRNSLGQSIKTDDDDDGTVNETSTGSSSNRDSYLTYTVTTAGTYYIDVQAYNNSSSGSYELNISIDGFKYTASGTNRIAVRDLLANDFDADGDMLTLVSVAGAGVSLVDNGNFVQLTGAVSSFTYTATDGSVQQTTTVNVQQFGTGYFLTGAGGHEILVGTSTVDTVYGGGGNDTLVGGDDIDFLYGEAGNDIIRGGAYNDIIDGGTGVDLLDFSDGTAGIAVTLLQSSSYNTLDTSSAGLGVDSYRNMEGIIGTRFNDTLTGSSLADVLIGGAGNDTLAGLAGNDTLTGGAGNDVFKFAESGALNADIITDYSASGGAGDKLDLSALLDAAFGAGSNANDFVKLVNDGADVKVQVDTDGAGSGSTWSDVATLSNYHTAGNQVLVEFEQQVHQMTVAA